MTWVLVVVLAALAFAAMALVLKAPRSGWEAIGAALLVGIAGYAVQAHPHLASSPRAPREGTTADCGTAVDARQRLAPGNPAMGKRMVIADAMARHGDFAAAAEVLRGAVADNPKDADAWLAMANALVSHADDRLTPAAVFAFSRAQDAAPGSPGPPYFLGYALARSGQLAEGRSVWADLLARTPADAPWRAELTARLGQLDAFIAERANGGNSPP
jgi:cytochrome c-type biogenesis protein CcmH